MQNVNHGLWTVAVLSAQDLFKTYHEIDPAEMAIFMSIIHLPWCFKIIYGMLSDNVEFCGTKRKSYLILMGVVQFVALMTMFIFKDMPPMAIALVLMTASFSEAFVNVVADAIMVVQARRDPESGAQDLIAYSWIAIGFGGIIGALFAGYMTENFHPRWAFCWYSFMGLVVSAISVTLSPESEVDPEAPEEE